VSSSTFATPHLTSQTQRRYCAAPKCEFDFSFAGATFRGHGDSLRVSTNFEVAEVYPRTQRRAESSAGGLAGDGTGDVVAETQFLRGWFCLRMSLLVGPDARPSSRTPWSPARCYLLDADGYVKRSVERP
jgi:hypothetical protein